MTVFGETCQAWTSLTPHFHEYMSLMGTNQGVGNHNYCRNFGNESTIWCYTTNPDAEWQYCNPLEEVEES